MPGDEGRTHPGSETAPGELSDALALVPGVADAEVDDDGAPGSVKIRLAPDADAAAVGAEVQRVLAARGMKSRLADDVPPAPVVSLPVRDVPPPPRPESPPPLVAGPGDEDVPVAEGAPEAPPPRPRRDPSTPAGSELSTLTVEESSDGVTVIATSSDGRRFSQRTSPTEDAVAAAVVAVVGALAEGRAPRLLSVDARDIDGTESITVMLERPDGSRVAGAAVVRAGRSYAVARATWAALRG